MFEDDDEGRKQQEQEPRDEEEDIITLAPGTTVMAEEAISLDSRSLQRILSLVMMMANDSCLPLYWSVLGTYLI
eukprot:scaffold1655_cov89-Skeletonema_dohrnii-CCMP3373.AAC.2